MSRLIITTYEIHEKNKHMISKSCNLKVQLAISHLGLKHIEIVIPWMNYVKRHSLVATLALIHMRYYFTSDGLHYFSLVNGHFRQTFSL